MRAFCSLAYSAARCLRVPPLVRSRALANASVLMSYEVMKIIQDEKGRACARFARSPTRRLAVFLVLMSCEVMKIIQDERAALARVLLARLLGGSLSQGSPFGELSFEVRRDKIGVVKSFSFSGKNFLDL